METKIEKKKFAFMIHPRVIDDLGRPIGKTLGIGEELGMKYLPKKFSEKILKHLPGRMGFMVCSKFDVQDKAEGYLIAILLTGRQMLRLPSMLVQERIMDGILYAQNQLGVERIGLGAYTAPKTLNGEAVVDDPRITCKITHGDALSPLPLMTQLCRLLMQKV